jgi:inner membrane protein
MDPLTHALSGAVIRNLGFRRGAALAVLVGAALAPDIDYLTGLWGMDVMLRHHRGLTHSFLALLVVPILVGLLFRKRGEFLYYWMLATAGYGAHIALDVTDSFGARLFAPLDWRAFSMELTYVAEPYIMALFAVSLLISYMRAERAKMATVAAMALLAAFIGVKHHYHDRTEEYLRASMQEYVVEKVSPMPNSTLRWWFVARNDREIRTGIADLFTDSIYVHKTYPRRGQEGAVERSKEYGVVKNFLRFAKYPYAEVQKNGNITVVKWRELSFAYSPRERFTATLDIGEDGKLVQSRIRI